MECSATLIGPDLVEVTFTSEVMQYTAAGVGINSKVVLDLVVCGNKITYKLMTPINPGDSVTYDYNGFGNLVALPSYMDIGPLNTSVTNNVTKEYIIALDEQLQTNDYLMRTEWFWIWPDGHRMEWYEDEEIEQTNDRLYLWPDYDGIIWYSTTNLKW